MLGRRSGPVPRKSSASPAAEPPVGADAGHRDGPEGPVVHAHCLSANLRGLDGSQDRLLQTQPQ